MSKDFNTPTNIIYVCAGGKCKKKGSKDIGKMFRSMIKELGLKSQVEVVKTNCTDRCDYAPVVCLQPENLWLKHTTEKQAREAFEAHVLQHKEV